MPIVIAIDGPAASGKSSVSRELAKRMGFAYVNSGALYRAVTWMLLRTEMRGQPYDEATVEPVLGQSNFSARLENGVSCVRVDGRPLADELCGDEVNANVSRISSLAPVRSFLLERLRDFARENDIVMEGRDIGSVVFGDTPYKFYLDASPEVRRQRREAQGQDDAILKRDRIDSSRKAAPLVIADDALVIDSTHLTVDGVVGEIIGRLRLKGLEPGL